MSGLSANAVDISYELTFTANSPSTSVFVYMFGAEIVPVQVDVAVISKFLALINPSIAKMLTPAVILLLVVMFPLCIDVVFIHRLGLVDE